MMKPVCLLIKNRENTHVLLTAVVESFAVATSKDIWTSEKLHANDAPKGDYLRTKGTVDQIFLF